MIATLGPVEHWVGALAAPLGDVDPRLALVALAFHAGNLVLRAVAWRGLLAAAYPSRPIPMVGVGAAYAAGVALNGLLPARAGEAAKVALVRVQLPGSSLVTIAVAGSLILLVDAFVGASLIGIALATGALPGPPPAPVIDTLRAHPAASAGTLLLAALGAWFLGRRLAGPVLSLFTDARQGFAALRRPGRYVRLVALPQAGAWLCRIAAVVALMAAFGLPASLPTAAFVVVLGGLSTVVPATPGGVGTQQVLVVYGLSGVASTTTALSFSIGMQVGITLVNTTLGVLAAMVVLRTFRPLAALRGVARLARG